MKNLKLHAFTFTALAVPALIAFSLLGDRVSAQPPQGKGGPGGFGKGGKGAAKADTTPRGLRLKSPQTTPGYVLFAPLTSTTTYLIDMDGQVVKTWQSDFVASAFVYLLENGHVMRGGTDEGQSGFQGGGAGGRFQEWDFDGKLLWDFQYNRDRLPHHDIAMLPNGHILAIAWEKRTAEQARAVGMRDEAIPANGIWPDMVIEFEPQRPSGARVVWEWHAWDHLAKPDEIAAHPELININGGGAAEAPPGFAAVLPGAGAAKGKGGPGGAPGAGGGDPDVFHMNAIFYNAKFDQIMLSVPNFNEIWILDHSTTTAQAAGHSGGKYGKGGDLLYRWGNPRTYGHGTELDQFLGFEHDVRWLPDGVPGAGHITVFSNRTPGPHGIHTRLYEIVPPVDAQGRYTAAANGRFGPIAPIWTYASPDFDANFISGAQRQKNGNVFVSVGPDGRMFEMTMTGQILWEYWSVHRGNAGILAQVYPYALFRGQKLAVDDPGLKGRTLTPQR